MHRWSETHKEDLVNGNVGTAGLCSAETKGRKVFKLGWARGKFPEDMMGRLVHEMRPSLSENLFLRKRLLLLLRRWDIRALPF